MNNRFLFFTGLFTLLILSCSSKNEPTATGETAVQASAGSAKENHLSLKINGVEWVADHDVFGAFHPKGYNKAIIIAGGKGAKDKDEQTFNINIYNTEGPGTYNFKDGNTDLSVAQLANWKPESFLCGSMMGHNMKVKVITASTKPDVIEATFEGELTCNSGEVLKVTDGKFYYHE
ncbi:MAG: hypothetical protein IT258_19985 [Saprospiraceae bacterium]|nr:hypothetical protein [Saprospiraceae bacterium]